MRCRMSSCIAAIVIATLGAAHGAGALESVRDTMNAAQAANAAAAEQQARIEKRRVEFQRDLTAYAYKRRLALAPVVAAENRPTNRAEIPFLSLNRTSLVDHPGLAELLSLLQNSANLTSGDSKPDSLSAAFTLYTLLTALRGKDPLDPTWFDQNKLPRGLSFSITRDQGDSNNAATDAVQDGTVYTVKYLLIDKRDPSAGDGANRVRAAAATALNYPTARLAARTQQSLDDISLRLARRSVLDEVNSAETNRSPGKGGAPASAGTLTDNYLLDADDTLRSDAALLVNESPEVGEAVTELRRGLQLALTFQKKHRTDGSPDDNLGQIEFERGGHNGTYTFNLSYGRRLDTNGTTRTSGLRIAGQFESLSGDTVEQQNKRMRLAIGLEHDGTRSPRLSRIQAKLTVRLRDGLELPISVTAANRTEFINEGKIKGRVGFTFDMEKFEWGKLLP